MNRLASPCPHCSGLPNQQLHRRPGAFNIVSRYLRTAHTLIHLNSIVVIIVIQDRLVVTQVARMWMLQAILRHQGRRHHTIRNQILPEIQYPLRHLRRPLVALGVPIA